MSITEEIARLHASVRARCAWQRIDWERAAWRAADRLPVVIVGLVHVEHVLMRRETQYASVTVWRAWLATLTGWVSSAAAWVRVMPSWSPWTGLAPPVVPALVQRK
jgi:hypothetical protein